MVVGVGVGEEVDLVGLEVGVVEVVVVVVVVVVVGLLGWLR